ncbi:MAG: hypothetical protein JW871_07635 [Endomicrobiales bacterium]|nr:hypothetical protein [Endomicrobiales bacterium]
MSFFNTFNLYLNEALGLFLVRIIFYMGLFNVVVILAVFVIKGKMSFEVLKKMRAFILYSFAMVSLPFIVALLKILNT